MNKIWIYFIVFLTAVNVQAQTSERLVNHLLEHNLKVEFDYFLEKNPYHLTEDSLNYFQIKSLIKFNEVENITVLYDKSKELIKTDTLLNQELFNHILNQNDSIRNHICNAFYSKEKDTVSILFYKLNLSIDSVLSIDPNYLPANLQNDFNRYKKIQLKKPILSATYSAIIPGLGKKYNGRNRSFRFTLLTQTVFGLKHIEVVNRLGFYHPYSFLTLGVFALYYGAGVTGAYFDCIEVKKEHKKLYIENVKNYINTL